MNGIHGVFATQYEVLHKRAYSRSEALSETLEQASDSVYLLKWCERNGLVVGSLLIYGKTKPNRQSGKTPEHPKSLLQRPYDSVKMARKLRGY